MGWVWYNLYVCPYCGEEVAEHYNNKINGKEYAFYTCLGKKCKWSGFNPGEIHGRVLE